MLTLCSCRCAQRELTNRVRTHTRWGRSLTETAAIDEANAAPRDSEDLCSMHRGEQESLSLRLPTYQHGDKRTHSATQQAAPTCPEGTHDLKESSKLIDHPCHTHNTAEAHSQRQVRLRRQPIDCLLYTSPSPRDATLSRMPSSA